VKMMTTFGFALPYADRAMVATRRAARMLEKHRER